MKTQIYHQKTKTNIKKTKNIFNSPTESLFCNTEETERLTDEMMLFLRVEVAIVMFKRRMGRIQSRVNQIDLQIKLEFGWVGLSEEGIHGVSEIELDSGLKGRGQRQRIGVFEDLVVIYCLHFFTINLTLIYT